MVLIVATFSTPYTLPQLHIRFSDLYRRFINSLDELHTIHVTSQAVICSLSTASLSIWSSPKCHHPQNISPGLPFPPVRYSSILSSWENMKLAFFSPCKCRRLCAGLLAWLETWHCLLVASHHPGDFACMDTGIMKIIPFFNPTTNHSPLGT